MPSTVNLALVVTLALSSAAHGEAGPPPPPPADDQLPLLDGCVSAEDRRTAEEGRQQKAFGPRPVPLGPIFWATADRTLVQAMLLYWRVLDVEEDTRLSLFLPLYLDHCSPAARTSIGPVGLFGSRQDHAGIAGWWGPYFYRRDENALSDVLFPLFWWMRDQAGDESTFVLGPGFHLKRGPQKVWGVAPLYFGAGNETDGSFFHAAPGLLSWGDARESTTLALQTYAHDDADSSVLTSFPFYFSWRDKAGSTWGRVVPPLLQVAWGDERELVEGHITGPWYRIRSGAHLRRGLAPIWFSSRGPLGEHWDWAPLGLTAVWGDQHETNVLAAQTYYRGTSSGWRLFSVPFVGMGADRNGDHFALVPGLAHFGTASDTRTFAFQTFVHRYNLDDEEGEPGFDALSFPFYFGGRSPRGGYYDVMPFGFARFGDPTAEEANVLLGPNWYQERGSRWSLLSPPFYFGRGDSEDGSYLHVVPLALTALWGDAEKSQAIVAGYYDLLTSTGHHRGLAPFYSAGETTDGASSLFAWAFREGLLDPLLGAKLAHEFVPSRDFHYRLAPPLAYLHFGTEDKERTFFAQTLVMSDDDSWDVWSVPFYFGGADAKGAYHVIPPLLFASAHAPHGGFTLMPGFYQERQPSRSLTLALQTRVELTPDEWTAWSVPFYFGGGDQDGHYHLALPLLSGEVYDKTDGDYLRVIAPALHASWKDETGVTNILGPWVDAKGADGRRFSSLVPLYAGLENEEGYFDMVTPFFYSWGKWAEDKPDGSREPLTRRALLLPALAYYSDQPDSSLLLAPLVFHRSDESSSDTVVFPGYWDIERPAFEATVIAGGWWDFSWTGEDGGARSLLLAPAYARWEDPEEILHVAGPVAWSKGKGAKQQAWSFHAEPVVSLWSYHPEHIRWQVGLGAFGYEREGDTEQMTLFWVDTPATSSTSGG